MTAQEYEKLSETRAVLEHIVQHHVGDVLQKHAQLKHKGIISGALVPTWMHIQRQIRSRGLARWLRIIHR